jgi:hypothetical protein
VAEDLEKLSTQDHVLTHIQTTIAHRIPPRRSDERVFAPTFGEFHGAIDVLREVFLRYYTILTHRSVIRFEPTAQFNVYEPFMSAWIIDPENFDYESCA